MEQNEKFQEQSGKKKKKKMEIKINLIILQQVPDRDREKRREVRRDGNANSRVIYCSEEEEGKKSKEERQRSRGMKRVKKDREEKKMTSEEAFLGPRRVPGLITDVGLKRESSFSMTKDEDGGKTKAAHVSVGLRGAVH